MDRRLALIAALMIPVMVGVFAGLTRLMPGLTGYAAALGVYWALLAAALVWRRGRWSLRPRWPGWGVAALMALCVGPLILAGAPALAGLPGPAVAACALAALINGPLEEAFWRGALLPRADTPEGWAAAPVAVGLFGLWHVAPLAGHGVEMPGGGVGLIVGATILGAVLLAARLRSGTAGAGAVVHAALNLFAFATLAAANPLPHLPG